MPPYVPRKREPPASPARPPPAKRPKRTLFETVDAQSRPAAAAEDKAFLDALGEDSSDSALSDVDSDEFEDALPAGSKARPAAKQQDGSEDEDEDEDEMDWEDALPGHTEPVADAPDTEQQSVLRKTDPAIGDLVLTLGGDGGVAEPDERNYNRAIMGAKGPSKRDRQVRIVTHCMHVQWLLFHNLIRNGWVCDKEVQRILLDQLPDGVKIEVQRWRKDSGLPADERFRSGDKGKGSKGKGRAQGKENRQSVRNQRDWGGTAERTEEGVPNLSHGDPVLKLLKYLAAYWKKRFRITAPGLRKRGYFPSAQSLAGEIRAWKNTHNTPSKKSKKSTSNNNAELERFGEKINSIEEFREAARRCEGSRDVGAQLFTALVRGLGLEARMVASLQPTGFGWSKSEEANLNPAPKVKEDASNMDPIDVESDSNTERDSKPTSKDTKASSRTRKPAPKPEKPVKPSARKSTRSKGSKTKPIDLDSDSSVLSSVPSSPSVTDVTLARPSGKRYDTDLAFPIYWTEVLSPLSQTYVPVSPLVISTIATSPDLLAAFEPRGAAAEKAKQVIAYVVAYSGDGTAKDVTVRYLKKHIFPGKTKGLRLPAEKIPVLNRKGKVRKTEEYDWFKRVMSAYARDAKQRTKADEIEDEGDLVPQKAGKQKKQDEDGDKIPDTLQGFKNSADYVLERHLRREEAILPGSTPVSTFTAGKGDKAVPESVYRRADVVACKTAESWHKLGRQTKSGEQPLKRVAHRAVTLQRKREIAEAERESGEKALQGLYSHEQTEWIIPPPIEDGKIPRNGFGNIDVYVPSMVPKGAVHIPLRGTAKICRKLEIDYAEACTGFEFGNRMAVPILTGVVVAAENERVVKDAWRTEEKAKKEKEKNKRIAVALSMWKKFVTGLRIIQRVKREYGEEDEGTMEDEKNPFSRKKREGELQNTFRGFKSDDFELGGAARTDERELEDVGAGGFFPPGHHEEEIVPRKTVQEEDEDFGSGFIPEDDDKAMAHDNEGGGFIIGEDDDPPANSQPSNNQPVAFAPMSLQSAHMNMASKAEDQDKKPSDADIHGSDEEEDTQMPTPKLSSTPRASTRGRGRGRGRASKATTTTRSSRFSKLPRKPKVISDDEEEAVDKSPSEDLPSPSNHGDDSPASAPSDTEPDAPPKDTPRRAVPRRSAARKSATAVRSHYFDGESDNDEDEEEEVKKPKRGQARRGRRRGAS
ncbi:Rad4-domain-containing protein [Saccharata proteae CBS 121410]|uniref:Rad4-domain-containing protein n=1 Tax=Saccharata proteae CBS 121410 TaxID=1314787 RepID=A0A9P4M1Y3_9PEZI|nr:Rad4-domain-containing protein [Saccharata proteae CBS 121410]